MPARSLFRVSKPGKLQEKKRNIRSTLGIVNKFTNI
jgi:hypothetical protein